MYFRVSTIAGVPDGRGPKATCLRRCSHDLALSKVTFGEVWGSIVGGMLLTLVGAVVRTLVGASLVTSAGAVLLACVGAIPVSRFGATELTLVRAIALSFGSIAFAAPVQPTASVESAPASNALRTA